MTEPKQALAFDPVGVAVEGRAELSLSGYVAGIEVAAAGADYGDTQVKAFMAEGEFGSLPIDHIWPLRPIKIPLLIKPTETLSFDVVRSKLEAKVAEINGDGGAILKRVLPSGKVIYADVVDAHLNLSASWLAENRDVDLKATLELQALPDLYEDEVEGALHEFTGDGSWTEVIKGTMPGRVTSLKVEDKSGQDQMALMWHFRRKNYSSVATAKWAYEAEELTPISPAKEMTAAEFLETPPPGGMPAAWISRPNLPTTWASVLSTNLKAGTYLTHQGLYQVWARVYASGEKHPWLRLIFDIGDSVIPSENSAVQVPGKGAWYLVNLGQINLATAPIGAHRWQGIIQARSENAGGAFFIDKLYFLCGDEGSGVLRASIRPSVGIASYKAVDDFNQEAGKNLNGLALPNGVGNWATSGSAKGDFITTGSAVKRETKEDAEMRTATPPITALTTVAAQLTFSWSKIPADATKNTVLLTSLNWGGGGLGETGFEAYYNTNFGETGKPKSYFTFWATPYEYAWEAGVVYTVTILVIAGRYALGWVTFNGEQPTGAPDFVSPTSGFEVGQKINFQEMYSGKETVVRTYNQFAMWEPSLDAVAYANLAASLSYKGAFRQSSDGAAYGPVSYPGQDLPRIPVSGPNALPVEIAINTSRGDTEGLPDTSIDKFAARLFYRPCWAEIPSS